ncbi:MAG: esterase/lipase family protein [bacterium]
MKKVLFYIFILYSTNLFSTPIIFITGIKSEGVDTMGFLTWNDIKKENPDDPIYYSCMHQAVGYKGYQLSPVLDCNKYVVLPSGLDENTMFNFSYYDTSSSIPGLISISADSIKVGFKIFNYINALGAEVCDTIAFPPFLKQFKDDEFDYFEYFPKYIDEFRSYSIIINGELIAGYKVTQESKVYRQYWRTNRYAEHLCKFIDKVLAATGASKVNLVCHSMGGLVARAALIGYGYSSKVYKIITVGTPHQSLEGDAGELFYRLFEVPNEWQRSGELMELDVEYDYTYGDIEFYDLETGVVTNFADMLGYDVSPTKIVCISGDRNAGVGGTLYSNESNDGFIFNSISKLSPNSLADYNPIIYASHSMSGDIGSFGNLGQSELSLTHCTYVTEFIKKWLIDDTIIEFTGTAEDLDAKFYVVNDEEGNKTSRSVRVQIENNGTSNINYGDFLSLLAYPIEKIVISGDTNEKSPYVGISLSNAYNNNRIIGNPMGSPIFMMNCEYNNTTFDLTDEYRSAIYLYDMKGLITTDKIYNYAPFDNWVNAEAPYVKLLPSATVLTVFTALNTYTIDWESNDIAVRNRLWYIRAGSIEIIDSMIPGSAMSKSFRIPPLRSSKSHGIPEYNLMNMYLRFELDDNGYFCEDNKWITVSTPDWNPDSLKLVYQDEDSIKVKWTDSYNLVDRIIRSNDNMQRDVSPLNTYTDTNFIRGMNNNYEVHSRWVYPNGDILISENDNNTHRETVFGIPCNAPKAYPIACIWQPNNKALIKWVDNSRKSANMGLYNQEAG